ncbi:TPA: hypothetical protein ACOJQP_000372 [Vibrio harveyi]|uniref:hypothetical protein n=1 Tax=Vibrio harveyi TaxID=669 RepID=UPI00390B61CA
MSELNQENVIRRYWKAYGGIKALFSSAFFYLAIAFTALLYTQWTKTGWWDTVLSVMPNLLGFTLGGFAMWVAIGDEDFKATISGVDEGDPNEVSPFMEVNATFAHFIFLQVFSILCAVVNKAYDVTLPADHVIVKALGDKFELVTLGFYAFSYFLFIYALLSALGSVLALFSVSACYDDYQSKGTGKKIRELLKKEQELEDMRKRKRELEAQLNKNETLN